MKSSIRTLESSKNDLESGFYNWACFKAQQAAELALKALLWSLGNPKPGHSLPRLLSEIEKLGIEVDEDIKEASVRLAKYYIATRYPDAWSEGVPEEYYTKDEAQEAIGYATKIIDWVRSIWKRLSGRG